MIYLLIASLIWGFSFGLIKYNLANIDPNLIAFLRLTTAFMMFLIYVRSWKQFNKQQFIAFATIGAMQYGMTYIACLKAYNYLAAHQIALFTAFTPIYIVLFEQARL